MALTLDTRVVGGSDPQRRLHHLRMAGYDQMRKEMKPSQQPIVARKKNEAASYVPLHDPPTYLDCLRYNGIPSGLKTYLLPKAPIVRVPAKCGGALEENEEEGDEAMTGIRRKKRRSKSSSLSPYNPASAYYQGPPPAPYLLRSEVRQDDEILSAREGRRPNSTNLKGHPSCGRRNASVATKAKKASGSVPATAVQPPRAVAVPVRITHIPQVPQHFGAPLF